MNRISVCADLGALRMSLNFMRPKDRETRAVILREIRARSAEFPPQAMLLLTAAQRKQVDTLNGYVTLAPAFDTSRAAANPA